MILFIILIALLALIVWIVKAAGWRFALKRFGGALLVLVIVTFGVSVLLRFASADEEVQAALEELDVSPNAQPCVTALGTGATKEAVDACVEDRGLDDGPVQQYLSWVNQIVFEQDLGYAYYKNQEPLSEVIQQRLPRTAWLFLYSQLLALFLAIPLGIWSAYQAGRSGRTRIPLWLLPIGVVVLVLLGVFGGLMLSSVVFLGIIVPSVVFHLFRGGADADDHIGGTRFRIRDLDVLKHVRSTRLVVEHCLHLILLLG